MCARTHPPPRARTEKLPGIRANGKPAGVVFHPSGGSGSVAADALKGEDEMRIAKPVAAVLATALAACGSGSLQDSARNAMPRSENVKMSSPNSASAAQPDGTIAQNSAV